MTCARCQHENPAGVLTPTRALEGAWRGRNRWHVRTGKRQRAHEHLGTATTMDRDMDMRFYLTPAEAEMAAVR